MAKIGGLRPNATLENDEENAEPALFGADETAFDQQDPGRSARRDGRRPRRTPGDSAVSPAADTLAESAHTFESQPESAELSGSEPESLDLTAGTETGRRRPPAGRARRGRRPPREEARNAQADDAVAAAPDAESVLVVDEVKERPEAPGIVPSENAAEVNAAFGNEETVAREAPLPDAYDASGQHETPPRLPQESSQPEAVDPARPKRSGWWQRARASGRR
jgi:ribonuclease E